MNRKTFLQMSAGALLAGRGAIPGLAESTIAKTRIKITKVEPLPIKANRDSGATGWMLVRVRTDQGVEGIGEGFPLASRSLPNIRNIQKIIETIGTQLVGTSPLEIERFLNRFSSETSSANSMSDLFRSAPVDTPQTRRSAGPPSINWVTAISAIEIALMDIAGQVAGLPIYGCWGAACGSRSPSMPITASSTRSTISTRSSVSIARSV